MTGVEINPDLHRLLQGRFKDFAGIARPCRNVTLVKAEARSCLSRDPTKYSIIQMSLIDTWAATGAGAFSLSENALYTIEAWSLFLDRLSDDGIFTVSRWHSPRKIGETGRVLALAAGTLLRRGIQQPSEHLALISAGDSTRSISTLLVSRRPFTPADVARLRRTCEDYGFNPILFPGHPPPTPLLRKIVSSRTYEELLAATSGAELRCDPTTDENPYFFNMLRLSNLGAAFGARDGIVSGNLVATVTLCGLILTLLVLAAATIVVPLLLREHRQADAAGSSRLWWGAIYFSLIGAAFMLIEIALIQRLTVLLSHPIYALGILLFTIIASTGVGSLLSDRLPLVRRPWVYVFPVATVAYIIGIRFALTILLRNMVAESELAKIAASIGVIFPMGSLMGMFFPTGMRLAKSVCPLDTPWYWALQRHLRRSVLGHRGIHLHLCGHFHQFLYCRRLLRRGTDSARRAAATTFLCRRIGTRDRQPFQRRARLARRRQRGRLATVQPNFPAAAQGPIDLDQAGGDFAAGLRQHVLLLHQVLLQLGDAGEIDRPGLVLRQHDLDRFFGVVHAGGLELRAPLGAEEGHQPVLHFLVGVENRLLVGGHQFLELGVLEPDVVQNPSVIQDVPLERRADAAVEGRGLEEIGKRTGPSSRSCR